MSNLCVVRVKIVARIEINKRFHINTGFVEDWKVNSTFAVTSKKEKMSHNSLTKKENGIEGRKRRWNDWSESKSPSACGRWFCRPMKRVEKKPHFSLHWILYYGMFIFSRCVRLYAYIYRLFCTAIPSLFLFLSLSFALHLFTQIPK